jgi:hypothetical protein
MSTKRGFGRDFNFRTDILESAMNWGEDGRKVGTCVALKGSKSRRNRSCLVYSSNNRLLLLQYVCECTVGVDVRDGTTSVLMSILSNIVMGCIVL